VTTTSTLARTVARNGTTAPVTKRVAAYTRQSVDRGDEYGSTDAQRAFLLSFINSPAQRAQGWVALDETYDDLGYSGSNVDRPGFQRLLRDVDRGRVDVIVVFKVDRLSRSLLDFAQVLKTFEQRGIEFVSVAQGISTLRSNPAARMLTQLLGVFAEFERSQIRERVSMKAAAIRRTGRTSGQRPILGYDPAGAGKLVVNPKEAATVRRIVSRFLECASVTTVLDELRRDGLSNKSWTNRKGERVIGRPFNRLTLRHLLSNPLIVGDVSLGAERYKGVHEAILSREEFDRTQVLLRNCGARSHGEPRNKWRVLLRGILECAVCGSAMTHHYASRGARRYSSYCCTKYSKESASACPGSRISLGDIEQFVVSHIKALGRDPKLIAATIEAAKKQHAERRPEIEAELRGSDADRRKLASERANLVSAIGEGGPGTGALVQRLAEIDEAVARIDTRAQELRGELATLERETIDVADVKEALAAFSPVWGQLTPRERERVLALLIEKVTFNGQTNEVSIKFWPNGLRAFAEEQRRVTK